jgi:hypothetical protein
MVLVEAHLLAQEARVPAIRAITDAGRRCHRDWIARAYAPALNKLPPAIRRRKLAQLTVVTDLATWRLLRQELDLGKDQTAAAIGELADACQATARWPAPSSSTGRRLPCRRDVLNADLAGALIPKARARGRGPAISREAPHGTGAAAISRTWPCHERDWRTR